MPNVQFLLNGQSVDASYETGMNLLEVLREECGIVSAKNGCAPEGACGCCAVLIEGTPALSCLRKPEQMGGKTVVTLEGIPEGMRQVLGDAFVLEGGVQCGFCIPGIIDAIQTAGDAVMNGGHLTRTEPRRNLFFGEEFGLSRYPAFAKPQSKRP